MNPTPSTFRLILKQLKPMIVYIFLSLLVALVIVFFTLLLPILVGKAIDLIIDINNVNFEKLTVYILLMVVSILLISLFQWLLTIINNHIVFKMNQKLRNDAIAKIQKLPLSYLDTVEKGNIVSMVINDVDSFGDGLLLGFSQLFSGIITILGTLGIMIYFNFWIALLVFTLTPISIFVAKFIASRIYNKFKEQAQIKGEQTSFIEEMINQQKVVHAFSHQKENEKKFDEINQKLKDCSLKANFYASLTNPLTRFVNALVYAGVAMLGAYLVLSGKGNVTVGLLTTFLSYANQYTKPFNEISGVITEMQNSIACASRVFKLLNEKELPDESHLKQVALKGNVTLDHVYFSYNKEHPLIEDFNIQIKEGQKIAIVGPTGCGKTTLINLLMRFYNIDKGTIYFDNYNASEIQTSCIRNNIGMVLQETWLKSGTIKENICFGNENASDEEIQEAITQSHCDGFIEQLPQGINTWINEEGGVLSQGQKQLLCIARLMVCKPPLLILDEATSSIDTRTEQKIQEAFNLLMQGKTTFIVAHRLSTIQNADRIIVMKEGHIVETGNHLQLLKKGGFYATLYMSQFDAVK